MFGLPCMNVRPVRARHRVVISEIQVFANKVCP